MSDDIVTEDDIEELEREHGRSTGPESAPRQDEGRDLERRIGKLKQELERIKSERDEYQEQLAEARDRNKSLAERLSDYLSEDI